jgi:hypothetical protein
LRSPDFESGASASFTTPALRLAALAQGELEGGFQFNSQNTKVTKGIEDHEEDTPGDFEILLP